MGSFDVPQLLIPGLIAQHGRNQARKPALLCGERGLDWAEFDAATNQVANGLASLGLEPGSRIALLMANSIEMALAIFGAGKAGVSVVPLNTSVNDAAVAAMIGDSGAAAVIASGEHCSRIDALTSGGTLPASLLRLRADASSEGWIEFEPWRQAQSTEAPAPVVTGDTECNIIYSSGTTGMPKGIVHSQQCRMFWAEDLAVALRYHSGAVTLCSLGLYSNISWVAMLSTVLVGGTIVVMPAFSAEGLVDHVERYGITHGGFVPVQLGRIADLAGLEQRRLGSLDSIMCCGSPLPPEVKRATRDRLQCNVIELYGLTEGIITTLAPEDFDARIESVGKPIPGQHLKLVGDDDREAAPGQLGEIVGHGRLVMEGYHNRPQADLEATWTDDRGRRWLRTGDIGRLDEEGFLYIVDRKKDMILSGGQNVYPADIEAIMREHPAVLEVAVIGVPSDRWGETPLAVIVPRRAVAVDTAELVDWTNQRVGKQQRITGAVILDSLPRNPNGKILKRELRAEYVHAAAARREGR
jgi:acyl-CoA synthetase (AMP-forming)/AMP-acid ligase II